MKIFTLILSFIFTYNTLACDFSNDIKKNVDGSYSYTKDCHIKVGAILEENKIKDEQIRLLNKSIELKDLAIQSYEKRTLMWIETTESLETRLNTIEKYKTTTNILYFGLGIALSGLAVYGASQLVK